MKDFIISDLVSDELKSDMVQLLIDNTPVAYIILDEDYRVRYINENFLKLRKLDRNAVMGEVCYNISNGGKPCNPCTVYDSREKGKKMLTLRKDTLPDGSIRYIDDYAIPLPRRNPDDPCYTLEIMVDRTKEMTARKQRDNDYDEILSLFSALLEAKDVYTATHSENVRNLAHNLAKSMNLSGEEVFEISIAASLHDIGKIRIPDKIINKPSKLTDTEFELIKYHPVASYEMIEDLTSFEGIKDIVRYHHERYDGNGYPGGLSGDEICIGAKIVSVVDAYEAMTSTRSYRKALSHDYAVNEIKKKAGTQFDPQVAKAFESLDFFHFDTPVKSKASIEEISSVDRMILPQSNTPSPACTEKNVSDNNIDTDFLLKEIFDNTPCGYVLMDTERNVLFASKYFLSFMGLDKDEVIGRKCYQAGCMSSTPCVPCAIEASLKTGKVEYMLQEQKTRNGMKTFDLYGMPLINGCGEVEYVIEVIIDRTDEVNLEKARERDFQKLIGMFTLLPELQNLEVDEPHVAQKISALKNRLKHLLRKGDSLL